METGLSAKVKKMRELERSILSYDKVRYNILFDILEELALVDEIKIRLISDFKKIPYQKLQDNEKDVMEIFEKYKKQLEKAFENNSTLLKEINNVREVKNVIFVLRNLLKTIEYKLIVHGKFISITHI